MSQAGMLLVAVRIIILYIDFLTGPNKCGSDSLTGLPCSRQDIEKEAKNSTKTSRMCEARNE